MFTIKIDGINTPTTHSRIFIVLMAVLDENIFFCGESYPCNRLWRPFC
jgi:hypothetical protein